MPAGGYGSEIDQAYIDHVSTAINAFAATYTPNKHTIILFPGGLGSKLLRDDNRNTNGQRDYYTSWIKLWALLNGEPRNLQIQSDGKDHDEHYVIPDGYIDQYIHAYGLFADWCGRNNIQLLVYGFDWRRSSKDAATYFLTKFLPAVDAAIVHARTGAGLTNYSFVGHSLGGMAVKLVVNNHADPYVQKMSSAITVAGPFYGYGAQIRRYLYGMTDINWSLASPSSQNQEMARIIGTMPGGYEFVYLSHQTYLDNQAAFASDPDYPLTDYPCVDPSGNPVDPYHPPPVAPPAAYYPFFGADNVAMLNAAELVAQDVAAPLHASVVPKFFNIRGVQKKNGQRLKATAVGHVWKPAPGGFNPDAPQVNDPMTDVNGYGDDTQPAWSTRLLQMMTVPNRATDNLPHVITIEDNIDHLYMMNYKVVQNTLARIIGGNAQFVFFDFVRPFAANRKQFDKFLLEMPQPRPRKDYLPEPEVRAMILEYLRNFTIGQVERLIHRAARDYLKSYPPPSRSKGRPEPLKALPTKKPEKKEPADKRQKPKRY